MFGDRRKRAAFFFILRKKKNFLKTHKDHVATVTQTPNSFNCYVYIFGLNFDPRLFVERARTAVGQIQKWL